MYVPTSTHFFKKRNFSASHEYVNIRHLNTKNFVNNLKINTSQVCILYFISQCCKLNLTVSLTACSINSFTDTEETKITPSLQEKPSTKIWLSWQFISHFKNKVNNCESSQLWLILRRTEIMEICISRKIIDLFVYYLALQHNN